MKRRTKYKREEHADYVEETWNEQVTRTVNKGSDTCLNCKKEVVWLPLGYGNGKCSCSYWKMEDIVDPKTYSPIGTKKVKTPYMDSYCDGINGGAIFERDPYPKFWGEIQFDHNKQLCEWVMERCKGRTKEVNTNVMML